jgi:hypothetical protein
MACADLAEEDEQILVPCNRKTKDTYVTGIATSVRRNVLVCGLMTNTMEPRHCMVPRET